MILCCAKLYSVVVWQCCEQKNSVISLTVSALNSFTNTGKSLLFWKASHSIAPGLSSWILVESMSWMLLIPQAVLVLLTTKLIMRMAWGCLFTFFEIVFSFFFSLYLSSCVVLASWEALTPELAASGGGCGCRTCCLDIAWFSAVSWHELHFWSQMKTPQCEGVHASIGGVGTPVDM